MKELKSFLDNFVKQAQSGDLKTSQYPREWFGFDCRVSFGMGMPARVPWIGFTGEGMTVSKGINPVYLYYKDMNLLVLAYGISETEESPITWPADIINNTPTISAYLNKKVPRYGDSFVFKVYKVYIAKDEVNYSYYEGDDKAVSIDLESDLKTILDYYSKMSFNVPKEISANNSKGGLFYMEKQLEDFIIHNWDSTELGKKYNLIIEEGELLSQQYRTDIGPIDILATDKKTGDYVVIELKKDQTSDNTIGQLARYMGWVKENKKTNVKGVIIAGKYDTRLDYALKMFPEVDVLLYKVDFKLNEFVK